MRRHLFLALSNPAVDREDEFHRWYDSHHLQDVVDLCLGFVRGRRYWRAEAQGDLPWQSLAIYDLEAEDVAAVHAKVSASVQHFTPSNGVFDPDHVAWVYTTRTGGDLPSLDTEERAILLAFFDNDPDISDALERHADQRKGEWPQWRYLVIREVEPAQSDVEAARLLREDKPDALWIYRSRGSEHRTDEARRAAILAD